MARTPEGLVKDAVTKVLREFEAYYFFPVTGGFGRSGVPDIIACYKGYFIAIECKAGVGKPTALQEQQIAKIRNAGGAAIVVNENTLSFVQNTLETIETLHKFRA
jgi:Holliday junction resolvase